MVVKDLISDKIPCLKTSDTGDRVLDWMEEFKVGHLPIVNEKQYLGLLSENDVLSAEGMDQPVGDYPLTLPVTLWIYDHQHVYDAIRLMALWNLSVLPVIDADNNYIGMVTREDLVLAMAKFFAAEEPGGIIILEIPHNSYNLSEIARIVESNDAKILSLYISSLPNSLAYQVTLKLNISELTRTLGTFERFGYKVMMSFFDKAQLDDTTDRYNLLMRYLNT